MGFSSRYRRGSCAAIWTLRPIPRARHVVNWPGGDKTQENAGAAFSFPREDTAFRFSKSAPSSKFSQLPNDQGALILVEIESIRTVSYRALFACLIVFFLGVENSHDFAGHTVIFRPKPFQNPLHRQRNLIIIFIPLWRQAAQNKNDSTIPIG